jgi:hypothetical protein
MYQSTSKEISEMNKVIFIFSFFIILFNFTYAFAQSLQDQSGATGRQVGATVGGIAGGATGNFATGGNVAAATAGSEIGRQVGGVVGEQTFRAIASDSSDSSLEPNTSSSGLDEKSKSSLIGDGLEKTGKEIPTTLDFQ